MNRITTLINGDLHYLNLDPDGTRDLGFQELCWRAGINPVRCVGVFIFKNGEEYEITKDDFVVLESDLIFRVCWR